MRRRGRGARPPQQEDLDRYVHLACTYYTDDLFDLVLIGLVLIGLVLIGLELIGLSVLLGLVYLPWSR